MAYNLFTIVLGFCIGLSLGNAMVGMIVTIIGWRLHGRS